MYRILSGIGYFLGIGPPLFGVFAAGAICDMALALATVGIGSCMPLIGLASTLLVVLNLEPTVTFYNHHPFRASS